MICLHICVCAKVHVWYLWNVEGDIGYPGTEGTEGCKPPFRC